MVATGVLLSLRGSGPAEALNERPTKCVGSLAAAPSVYTIAPPHHDRGGLEQHAHSHSRPSLAVKPSAALRLHCLLIRYRPLTGAPPEP